MDSPARIKDYGAGDDLESTYVIDVSDADRIIAEALPPYPAEVRSLGDAHGAVLRQAIRADRPQPPFDRVTMDGIAIRWADWESGQREFRIAGVQAAGEPQKRLDAPNACLEVMTGAVMPEGADCVIKVEDIAVSDGAARLQDGLELASGNFVHPSGSDAAAGQSLLEPGVRLTAPRIAIAAAFGVHEITVAKPPSVAIVSTGDELVEAHETPLPHQIRLSNVYAIEAGLRMRGFSKVERHHIADDRERIQDAIAGLLDRVDMLLLTGGVSMGKFDYVPETLRALNVEQRFHKVAQRPGKPLWFGVAPGGKPVFGLPGNPVSAIVCFRRYVLHHVEAAMGLERQLNTAALAESVTFAPNMTYFMPVSLASDDSGRQIAQPLRTNTSGDFGTLGHSDAIIELPRDVAAFSAGYVAPVYRWT